MSQVNTQQQSVKHTLESKMGYMSLMDDTYATHVSKGKNDEHEASQARAMADPVHLCKSYDSLSKIDKYKLHKEHKKRVAKNQFVQESELHSSYMEHVMAKKVEGSETMTQEDLFKEVKRGDCSQMQLLDGVLRNRAATEYMMRQDVQQLFYGDDIAAIVQRIKTRNPQTSEPTTEMLNPLLRMGISLMMNSDDVDPAVKEKFRKVDEALNTELMVATIIKRRGDNPKNDLLMEFTKNDWARNFQSQKFLFKTMFMCQLGRLKKVTKDRVPPSEGWSGSVANAFAHCSRVMVTFPGDDPGSYNEQAQKRMIGSYKGLAGFETRGGATHTMSRKKKGGGKPKEVKFFSPLHQSGMDVAIGGLGNGGIPKGREGYGTSRRLHNDGTCGHVFMHMEEGTKDKHAGMLIGFESDAYQMTNQTGHTHDKKATGEFASSFGGQRCDEIGDKYGGRTADLSYMQPEYFTYLMELADTAFTMLMQNKSANGAFDIEGMTRRVCGGVMSRDDLIQFVADLTSIVGHQQTQQAIGSHFPERM